MKEFNAGIVAYGKYLPLLRETKEDFIKKGVPEKKLHEWGVYEHRVSDAEESSSEMSVKAAKNLMDNFNIKASDIDLIIDCAFVPDYIFPGNSHKVQHDLGACNSAVMDIGVVSGGAIPQLVLAKSLILSGAYKNILLTSSCKFSCVADENDWLCYVLAGDGAAALLVSAVEKDRGILASDMVVKGEFYHHSGIKHKSSLIDLNNDKIYSNSRDKLLFFINGANTFFPEKMGQKEKLDNFILDAVPDSVNKVLEKSNLSPEDVNMWITHQNVKALSSHWMKCLGINDINKCHNTLYKYGNLYNANLLINLIEANEKYNFKLGDIIMLCGLSSGFSAGSLVMRW